MLKLDRDNPALENHLWAIGKLLTFKPSKEDDMPKRLQDFHERFLFYIVAACHRKIFRRMNHSQLSQPYLKCLNNIILPLQPNTLDKVPAAQATAQFESPELVMDKGFLRDLATAYQSGSLNTPPDVPHLLALAHNIEERHIAELFTKDTCHEFHAVFLALLTELHSSLKELSLLHNPTGKDAILQPLDTRQNLSRPLLNSITTSGSLLSKLSRGKAITLYFQAIESELKAQNEHDHLDRKLDPAKQLSASEISDATRSDDEELNEVQPFTDTAGGEPTPLWKSNVDWLRLIVIHFESSENLTTYAVLLPHSARPINIHLVVSPQHPDLDRETLPWESLFTNSLVNFPVVCSNLALQDRTNKDIHEFLSIGAQTVPQKLDKDLEQISENTPPYQLGKICQYFAQIALLNLTPPSIPGTNTSSLAPMDVHGWGKNSMKILALFLPDGPISTALLTIMANMTKPTCILKDTSPQNIDAINLSMLKFDDSAIFFRSLNEIDSDFSGSLHCEACLASLLVANSEHLAHESVKLCAVSNHTHSLNHSNFHVCAQHRVPIESLECRSAAAPFVGGLSLS